MESENEAIKTKKEQSFLEQFVGYYDWEGLPCRIRKDEDQPNVLISEVYVPGKGFAPAAFSDVALVADKIDAQTYQNMMVRLSMLRRNTH